jgi:hypothetical protein
MKNFLLILTVSLLFSYGVRSQGCIAIRNISGFGQFAQLGYGQSADKWALDINNRYFNAFEVYSGKERQPNDGIHLYEFTTNFELTRILENGWSIALDMPIAANSVTSTLEHQSGIQHTTSDFGLGDMRFTVYKWLFNTNKLQKGNIQFGLGIKFPTGNYNYEDYFYYDPNNHAAKMLSPVNVAIQLGDGGTGITTELNGYYIFNRKLSIYGNFFYLINPRDVNGTYSLFPNAPANIAAVAAATGTDVNSVPDSYTMRAGVDYSMDKLVAALGLRFEGVPAYDLIGKSDGLRRVGYIFSIEPGLQYKFKKSFLYTFVTIPMARATVKAPTDKQASEITGTDFTTPGHFANYVLFLGYTFTF